MGETMTLWQRCEALGPQSVDCIEIEKDDDCWIIVIDGFAVHYIHENVRPNRAWLCDAIIQRFEAINRPMVDSKTYCQSNLQRGAIPNVCVPSDATQELPIPEKLNDQVAYFAASPQFTVKVIDTRWEQLEANVALLMEEYNAKRLNLKETQIPKS